MPFLQLRSSSLPILVLVASASACAPEPTWVDDVEPLLQENCFSCHGPGDVAGLDLTDYATAREARSSVSFMVESRRMPPWNAADGCNEYEGDRRLTEEQIATLVAWADGDAAHGDGEPSLVEPVSSLDRVDVEAPMPVDYEPTQAPDDYRCFLLDWAPQDDTWITGFEASPGDRGLVHHVIAFLVAPDDVATFEALDAGEAGPGWSCFGGPGGGEYSGSGWIGGWAPGDGPRSFPDGSGLAVEAGSRIVLQVHYHPDPARPGAKDRTTLRLRTADSVDRPGRMQPWSDPDWFAFGDMPIPANTDGVSWTFDYPYWVDAEIHSVNLHMHTLGKSVRLSVVRLDGSETCLVDIPAWDFDQQQTFRLAEPLTIAGEADEIVLTCTWDNPTDREVNWGDRTEDEMCLATMYITPREPSSGDE
jgi:hypothetical protein